MVIRTTTPTVRADLQADLERFMTSRPDDPDVRRFEAAYAAATAAHVHHDTPLSQARRRAQLARALRDRAVDRQQQ